MSEKVQVTMILEILGRPKENVLKALQTLIERIASEKGAVIIEQTIHEPLPVKDSKDLFTSFSELTLELDSLSLFFGVMFAYMPANIELITPEKFTLTNSELSQLGNKLLQRLHDYDAIAKKMIYERDIFANKLKEVAPNLFPKTQQPQSFQPLSPQKAPIKKSKNSKKISKKKRG